ncbi:FimV/HubP family polar landmark protein [Nitrogeniibacter mangrovi]|uniref:FimV/HubP family polar landmark protein n=1 Tax=Nitrogeniibacter mangrovi TaxID=2016596 RepID=UPI001E2CD08D|nr:FimV/HubP family polar landmark protein [Nitrogeniibacter mangrovi]
MNTFQKTSLRATLIAATLAAMPFAANAAGLGRISVLSALGQPLRAEIELTATSNELTSMTAAVAAPTAFKDAGVAYVPALASIRMSVERRGGRNVLRLTSTKPINEPFVDMLVELNWSAGRLLREYTFLLDPPDMPAPAAATNVGTPVQQPVARAARPIRQAATGDYRVQRGDTLAKIARQNMPEGVSMDQMLIALYRANPEAFIDENINRLRAGVVLNVPDGQAAGAIPRAEARQQVIAHAADFNAYRRRVAERVAASAPAEPVQSTQASAGKITAKVEETPTAVTESKDQVKVSKTDTGAAGAGDAGALQEANRRMQALEEDVVARDKALTEANDRLAALEKNIAELQKLIELKNQNLASLQQQAQGQPPAAAPAPAEAAAPMTEAAPVSQGAEPMPAAEPKAGAEEKPEQAMPAGAQDALDKELQDLVKPPAAEETAGAEHPAAEAPAPAPEPMPVEEATKPVPPPAAPPKPAPAQEPGFMDSLMENPALLYGGAAALIGVLGFGLWRSRKSRDAGGSPDETAMASVFPPDQNSVFGETGGQSVDTGSSSLIQTDFSQSGLSAIDTDEGVDPVAEADVYMAYGRDAQAEEILLDAMKADPSRTAIHLKLLEIYSQRKNLKQFETTAAELYTVTGGKGEAWEKAVEMGLKLDPDNPLFSRTADMVGEGEVASDEAGFTAPSGDAGNVTAAAAAGVIAGVAASEATEEDQEAVAEAPDAGGESAEQVPDDDQMLDFSASIPTAEEPSPSQMKDTWAIPGDLNQFTDSDLAGIAEQAAPEAEGDSDALGVDTGDLDFNLDLDEVGTEEKGAATEAPKDESPEIDSSFEAADSSLEFNLDLEAPPAGDSMAETSVSGFSPETDLESTDLRGELSGEGVGATDANEEVTVDLESTDLGTSSGIDFPSSFSEAAPAVDSPPQDEPEEDMAVVDLEKTNFDGSLLDFDFELDEQKGEGGEQEMMATSLDLSDINLDLEGADADEGRSGADAPAAEGQPESDDASVEFDLPELSEAAETVEPEAPTFEAEATAPESFTEQSPTAQPADAEEDAMMASLTKSVVTSLTDSRAMPDLPADEELNQEIDTKLELARAYEEMGDGEGARELLDEVMRDGDAAQQEQARSILARLG